MLASRNLRAILLAILLLQGTGSTWAQVVGTVVNAQGEPIAAAWVALPEHAELGRVQTNAAGQFQLPSPGAGVQRITAVTEFDLDDPRHYRVTQDNVLVNAAGSGQITLILEDVPGTDNLAYLPIKAEPPGGCGDCHSGKHAEWSTSMHAAAAVDPWVLDLFDGSGTPDTGGNGYVYTTSHAPGSTGTCAVCHTPTANPRDAGAVMLNAASTASALEGVTCSACHQLAAVDGPADALHLLGGARVYFPGTSNSPETHSYVWGPLPDSSAPAMFPMYAPWLAQSRFCASCHEYVNPDSGAPGQRTYSEWLASDFAQPGPGFRDCQDCHMPQASVAGTIADSDRPGAIVRPPDQIHAHQLRADASGNLADALVIGVQAQVSGGIAQIDLALHNQGLGHAFPTGIALRNALLVLTLRRNGVALSQSSGPVLPWWADDNIAGVQSGDLAGQPGLGFAKVLQGRIGGQGATQRPVLFIDAESVSEDSVLAPGQSRSARLSFVLGIGAAPGDQVDIEARLIYRRAWRALAVEKGWTERIDGRPWEQIVASEQVSLVLNAQQLDQVFANGFENP
jgi:hypothetical protein